MSSAPTYDRYGRMQYHPDFHENHLKSWTIVDHKYLIENYERLGPEQISFDLGRTIGVIMTRVYQLRKKGLMSKPSKSVRHKRMEKGGCPMKESPILFNAEMVRAVLDGRKTQTRRIVKPYIAKLGSGRVPPDLVVRDHEFAHRSQSPFGNVGDRLWVRENWQLHNRATDIATVVYAASHLNSWTEMHKLIPADLTQGTSPKPFQEGWRPSIHMPRWASRITLEITAVSIKRLHQMNDADAIAEGCSGGHGSIPGYMYSACPREHFAHVWQSVYGKACFDANPWVWLIEFKRIIA